MTDSRPDPDRLLAKIKVKEIQARRGKLKLFFGASAGVGKTFAMLSAARVQQQQGVDVIIGVIETHGRAETEALVTGLPRLELKEIRYRDRILRNSTSTARWSESPSWCWSTSWRIPTWRVPATQSAGSTSRNCWTRASTSGRR